MCNMSFVKGMGAGLILGACVGMSMMPNKKCGKRMLSKAAKTISTLADDLGDLFGL